MKEEGASALAAATMAGESAGWLLDCTGELEGAEGEGALLEAGLEDSSLEEEAELVGARVPEDVLPEPEEEGPLSGEFLPFPVMAEEAFGKELDAVGSNVSELTAELPLPKLQPTKIAPASKQSNKEKEVARTTFFGCAGFRSFSRRVFICFAGIEKPEAK